MGTESVDATAGIDLTRFYAIFFEEAAENLAQFEQMLLRNDLAAADDEALNAIFRCAHSIKGGAATFGFADVAGLTHQMETLLDKLRRHEVQALPAMVDVLLQAGDALKAQLARHQGGDGAVVDTGELLRQMEALSAAAGPLAEDSGFGFFDDAPGAPAGAAAPAPTPVAVAAAASTAGGKAAKAAPDAASLRVPVEKVDQLINLVGELVITQAMLAQNARGLAATLHQPLSAGLADLARHTRALQEAVMSIRMIPMAAVFNRFPRMLRDLAARLGKQVDLQLLGESTELDKSLVEKITDPLTHLVRNSCDHGIETPAERRARGKPEHGTITLTASHQGGHIVIEVRDDGQGLSRNKLLARARERGLHAPDSLSDSAVYALIFAPGFSTADVVTDISGRGVGMDVVQRNIALLGGSVEIDSTEGRGMCVKVRLPLTLAIMDGMNVGVGAERYILPLGAVVESLQVGAGTVKSLGGSGRVVQVRGAYLPLVDLEQLFGVPRAAPRPAGQIMVVVEAEGSRVALLVDGLLGLQQVVVKNLEANYRKVAHVSGATILGDGRVALILDVASLVHSARQVQPVQLTSQPA